LKKGVDAELIKYWNDKNQREVDIIIDRIERLQVYELKYKKSLNSDDLTGVKAFEKVYATDLKLVNLDVQEERD
jgi:hypothetical protein